MKDINTNKYPKSPGIYSIVNVINNKVYIGSTKSLYKRLIHHRHRLRNNSHSNKHLQNAWNKYGEDNFDINVLEYCENTSDLYKREEFFCKQYDNLYNIKTIEKASFGYKRILTDDTKNKISKALKGRTPSNLKDMQKIRWKRIAKLVNEEIIEIYNSCAEASRSINMEPKAFHAYINKIRKSKYFPDNVRFIYYE